MKHNAATVRVVPVKVNGVLFFVTASECTFGRVVTTRYEVNCDSCCFVVTVKEDGQHELYLGKTDAQKEFVRRFRELENGE